jgi:hypothetical protein
MFEDLFSDVKRDAWFIHQNAARKVKYSDDELNRMWIQKINMHLNPTRSAHVISDIQPYESPATGKMITSRSERREDFKVSGCREWEGMACEQKEASKRKRETEQKQDAALEHEVRTVYSQMPDEKKQALVEAVS